MKLVFEKGEWVNEITPDVICEYLGRFGWIEVPMKRKNIRVFQYHAVTPFIQVTVPVNESLSDYVDAMQVVVEKIALAEHRTLLQVILRLENPEFCLF